MMNEPSGLNDVAKFHDTFNLPIIDSPSIPDAKRCELRVNLLEEEVKELKEAIETNDLVEIIDALCDIQYVLSGAVLEFGVGEHFKAFFDEVQRSNMSKTCKTIEEAQKTQEYYKNERGMNSFIEGKGDEFLVYRTEDKKVLKSINYSPADIKGILTKLN